MVGPYKGIKYKRAPLNSVFPDLKSKAKWYFIQNEIGEYAGDHFRTLREMKEHIDAHCAAKYL